MQSELVLKKIRILYKKNRDLLINNKKMGPCF